MLLAKVESMLSTADEEGHGLYFGSELKFTEIEIAWTKQLLQEVERIEGQADYVELNSNNGLIPKKIEKLDVTKEALLKRGSNVSKRWYLWLVMDAMKRTVVTVTWRPVSSGIAATRMICVSFRTDVSRRCAHEMSCEKGRELENHDGLDATNVMDVVGVETDSDREYSGE